MFENKFPDKLTFNNLFVVIRNQWDLNAHRNNKNHKERISTAIPDLVQDKSYVLYRCKRVYEVSKLKHNPFS